MLKKVIGWTIPTALAYNSRSTSDHVDFQTFELDGEIEDMMWCGPKNEVVLVHTTEGSIYRSRDRGSNWKRLRSLMETHGAVVADEEQDVSKMLKYLGW